MSRRSPLAPSSGGSRPNPSSSSSSNVVAISPSNNTGYLAAAAAAVREDCDSMRRLKALKEKITKELETEERLRKEAEQREPIVPLSLAGEYNSSKRGGKRGVGTAHGKGTILTPEVKDRIASLKLDKWVQRQLEEELERKTTEASGFEQYNERLRHIIGLRQDCNVRREEKLQSEIQRLSSLATEVCVDANDMDGTMQRLRAMNTQIQEGAAQLKVTIEEKAEAERLGVMRNYRVKIREAKQQLDDQKRFDEDRGQAWISQNRTLEKDKAEADLELNKLEVRQEQLEVQNKELQVMQKHQEEQREALTTRIAIVKRDNKRLTEHVKSLEEEVLAARKKREGVDNTPERAPGTQGSRPNTRGAPVSRRTTPASGSARNAIRSKAEEKPLSGYVETQQKRQNDQLKRAQKTLEELRTSLRQVRSAHVELLQERTEIELFLRQCIEDVRRDIYRFTVVSNISKDVDVDSTSHRVLDSYDTAQRRKLNSVLSSKLRVFTALHSKMFPQKMISLEELDELDGTPRTKRSAPPPTMSGEDERMLDRVLNGEDPMGSTSLPHVKAAVEGSETATMEVDRLWNKWQDWTAPSRREDRSAL